MIRRLLQTVTIATLAAGTAYSAAAGERPPTVRDLHYGEVLFHFYQDDYFAAIIRLLAAREQGRMPNHAEEAELLLGGLNLSYGLHVEAEDIFRRLLDSQATPPVRDRAWYYLGKMAYQKGLPQTAERALARMSDDVSAEQRGERQLLIALARLDAGDAAGAAEALQDWRGDRGVAPYARYNLGVALVRAEREQAGLDVLDQLGRDAPDWALRDKTNLTLGYALLQAGQPKRAREALQRVRAEGPFTDRALLGLGWADVALEQYAGALGHFTELSGLPLSSSAAQEARLALPYIYARLGDRAKAAQMYQAAIDSFEQERTRLRAATAAIQRGELLPVLLDPAGAPLPDSLPGRDYLVELLAANAFQEALRTYRDLLVLQRNLDQWSTAIASFDHMLETREARFRQSLPQAEQALAAVDLAALEQRRSVLEDDLLRATRNQDALALASQPERRHWQLLDAVDQRLAELPAAETARQREQGRLLRGLLQWQMEQQYPARRWEAEKALRGVREELATLEAQRKRLVQAQLDAEARFTGFRARIDLERERIAQLQPQAALALADQAKRLEGLAADQLHRQYALLEQQIASARFGLARLYDEAIRAEDRP